jgi:flagellar basal-body rod modification protein FlgD
MPFLVPAMVAGSTGAMATEPDLILPAPVLGAPTALTHHDGVPPPATPVPAAPQPAPGPAARARDVSATAPQPDAAPAPEPSAATASAPRATAMPLPDLRPFWASDPTPVAIATDGSALAPLPPPLPASLPMPATPPPVPVAALSPLVIAIATDPGTGAVEVALSPDELGRLHLHVMSEGDHLRIALTAERPETLDLLRRHADQLLADLRQAGFGGATLSFGQGTGGDGRAPAATPRDAGPQAEAAPPAAQPCARADPAPGAYPARPAPLTPGIKDHPMEIASTTTQPPAATAPKSAITSDYNTFLRMLTTQMQNQDPLNPIDSADYAVQLATFSGVEQQTRTNQLIQQLIGAFDVIGLSEFAGWVGREARSAAPVAHDGTPVTLHLTPEAAADRAVLAVRNAAGTVVAREDVVPGGTIHVWQGRDIAGAALPPGRYSFTVERYAGDTLLSQRPAEAYARITEVRADTGGARIILSGGVEIRADAVTGLREPG